MSAAMSAKLLAAAALANASAAAKALPAIAGKAATAAAAEGAAAAGAATGGQPLAVPVGAAQQNGLIKAAAAAPAEAAAAASAKHGDAVDRWLSGASTLPPPTEEQPPPASQVNQLVQYFEQLSPSKASPGDSLDILSGPGAAEQAAQQCGVSATVSSEAGTGGGTRRPLPGRTNGRRAFLKTLSRHARFEEGGGQQGGPASAVASDSPVGSGDCSSSSAALLSGKQRPSGGTSTGKLTASSRLQASDRSSDQLVASELRDADSASDISGASSNSTS